jgi:hypothetical protein
LFGRESQRDISHSIFSDSLRKLDFFLKFYTKYLLLITFYHIKAFCSKILSKQKCFRKEIKLCQVFVNIFPAILIQISKKCYTEIFSNIPFWKAPKVSSNIPSMVWLTGLEWFGKLTLKKGVIYILSTFYGTPTIL